MRDMLHPGFLPCPWFNLDMYRRLLLGGCLLVLVLSGCTLRSQGHVRQNVLERAPDVRAVVAYCDRSQSANALACYKDFVEKRRNFERTLVPAYRELAEILMAEGRLLEAQQVLDWLKVEEYSDFARRNAFAAAAALGQTALTPLIPGGMVGASTHLIPEEAVWAQRYTEIADQVATLGAERESLRTLPDRTAAQDARLAQVESDLTAANGRVQRFLDDLQEKLGRGPLAQEKLFQLRESQGLMADLRDLEPGTVALHTFVGAEKYYVILTTPDVQLVREVPLAASELSRKVWDFRAVLAAVRRQPSPPDPRPLAHELYELLVGPVASDLRAVRARTLLWSLDGVLRYLPLAALHDGEGYLIER